MSLLAKCKIFGKIRWEKLEKTDDKKEGNAVGEDGGGEEERDIFQNARTSLELHVYLKSTRELSSLQPSEGGGREKGAENIIQYMEYFIKMVPDNMNNYMKMFTIYNFFYFFLKDYGNWT